MQTLPPSPPAMQAEAPAGAACDLFVVIYQPGPSWRFGKPMSQQDLRAHGTYHADLLRRGLSVAAGGFVGRDGGMAILRVRRSAEAETVVAADPAIRSGVFTADLRGWRPSFVSNPPPTTGAPNCMCTNLSRPLRTQ